ncbi:MAG: YbaB/EbfC family nucleoid-associated protein [Gammaproteobacteria bacterium]|nr:YbaB/EbfC family nucleoid-associated protein [Gammaproteobacteria bacterium]
MFDGPWGELMKQAQKMQDDMKKAQEALQAREVTGESGAGLVTVRLNGKGDCLGVAIHPPVLADTPEIVGELVAAAINDAMQKLEQLKTEQMSQMTAGLQLPPGFKFPFS